MAQDMLCFTLEHIRLQKYLIVVGVGQNRLSMMLLIMNMLSSVLMEVGYAEEFGLPSLPFPYIM